MSARLRLLLTGGAALACLIPASHASADPPTTMTYVAQTPPGERLDLRDFDPVAFQCGAAHVELSFRDEGRVRVYYENGKPIRVARFTKGSGTLFLVDDATGADLASESGSSPRTETFDLPDSPAETGTYTLNGTTMHNNVPGLGRVAHAGGSYTYELLDFDTSSLDDPANLQFHTGDLLHASAKSTAPDPDWCAILQAL